MTDVDVLFAGIPVTDFASALDWYTRLFGRPPDIVAHASEVMWRLSSSGCVYVFVSADRAGHGTTTLAVADLAATADELKRRGIVGGPIEPVGSAGRKAKFTDADGNVVDLIEVTG